jgi:hypothetical protein
MRSVWILINKYKGTPDLIVGVFKTEKEAHVRMMSRFNRSDRPDVGTYEIEEHFIEEEYVGPDRR